MGSKIEIYLTKNIVSSRTGSDTRFFIPASLDRLDTILILDSEILSYEIRYDTSLFGNDNQYFLNLSESGSEKIAKLDFVELCCGRKFVITVDRQPIYGGYFWNLFSSYSCDWIIIPAIPSKKLPIEAGYPNNVFTKAHMDPRDNHILIAAFESGGRLVRVNKKE